MADKHRSYAFVVNNYTVDDSRRLTDLSKDCKYLIVGEEGAECTPHYQGYVSFDNPRSMRAIRAMYLPRAKLMVAKGSAAENRVYCSKEGAFWEFGELPAEGGAIGGTMERQRWEDARQACKEGDLDAVPADIFMRCYRTCKEIKKDYMAKPEDLEPGRKHQWFVGPPGTGKSRKAREDYPRAYFKPSSKWWDGYQGEENVIIDDLEKDALWAGHFLKIWGDMYSFIAETKGGGIHIRPKNIIITSNYTIEDIFADPVMAAAIHRRFHVTHFADI